MSDLLNGNGNLFKVASVVVALGALYTGYTQIKESLVGDFRQEIGREVSALNIQHQEDIMSFHERFDCWLSAEGNLETYMKCKDRYDRSRIRRRIEREDGI